MIVEHLGDEGPIGANGYLLGLIAVTSRLRSFEIYNGTVGRRGQDGSRTCCSLCGVLCVAFSCTDTNIGSFRLRRARSFTDLQENEQADKCPNQNIDKIIAVLYK